MNKLTKVLSVFVLAGAIGTGVAGVAGCAKPNDEEKHTHNYTYVNDNNGKHHEHCDNEGCDTPDKPAEDHTWVGDKCDKCDAPKPQAKYSITYNIKGHGTAPANVAEATNLPETLPTLTEEGWTFGGWFTDEGCNTAAVEGAKLTANITLYAKWTKNQGEQPNPDTKYSITYNVKGHGTAPVNVAEATNLPETLPTLTEEGWTFGGWFTDEGCNTKAVAGAKLTANITLYAKWTKNQGGEEGFVIPATATGIMVEGITAETITLSESKKTHTINKDAIEVYLATGDNADVKGDKVPAEYVVLELKDSTGAPVESWENIAREGVYKVNVSLKEDTPISADSDFEVTDFKTTVTVTINNPVKADSLAVKSGTLTQSASVQNKMSADWKYTVTLANGDVIDYTEAVTVDVDTRTVGEKTATLTSGNLTGTVKVTITEAKLYTETYASNFSGKPVGALASEAPDAEPVELFKSANGKTKLEARGVKVEANGNSAAKECDGKFFANRAPLTGATFTKAGALQANQRYFILTTEGPAKLTVYWSRNSSKDDRGISVFDSSTVEGGISALTPSTATVGKDTVVGDGSPESQAVQKFEVNIPAAGTYWITSADFNNIYFYYIELTEEFEGEGQNVVLEDGEKTLAQVKVSHTTEGFKQEFTVGSKFTVDGGYSFNGTFIAANTAKKSEEALTEVTYWAGDVQLIPNETVLTAETFGKLGENAVTVKYGDETVTGSYTINLVNALGVNSVTATLKSGVTTEVAQADSKVTITWANFDLTPVGENTNVDVVITAVSYLAKDAAAGTEGTAIEENGTAIGVGDYVVTFTVTVTDKENSALTETFTATCNLGIIVAGQLENVNLGSDQVKNLAESITEETDVISNANGRIFITADATNTVAMDANSKTVDGISFTHRIKLGGAGGKTYRSMGFEVKAGAKIVIYAMSSSGSATRLADLLDATGNKVANTETTIGTAIAKYEFMVEEAGTYYFAAQTGGINVYGASILYK